MKLNARYGTVSLWLLLPVLLLLSLQATAQSSVRAEIDSDRRYLNFDDEKALEKSREYIRKDSTYYIGYMYQGGFMFSRANDELGFSQAIVPLQKAMDLLEKDYDQQLRTRTSDLYTYLKVNVFQNDYCTIAYWLQQSYQNIENPAKAFAVLQHVRDRNLQLESSLESYNMMAWIYHRNRVYTPATGEKYAFLKNSVRANDSMAYLYLDSAILKIANDLPINSGLFDPSYLNRQYLYTYHYKAILFDYSLQMDSANYYYNILLNTGYYSPNNYAEFQMAQGDFQNAEEYFKEAEAREGSSEKRTREYYYMRGQIDVYKSQPAAADSLLRKVLELQGSTPGFGWHSIGLARALQYEGLTAESQERINKAARFHELHIATTWGQEQYNLSVATLNYTNKVHFAKEYCFENAEWYFWLNPVNWYNVVRLSWKVHQYKTVLQMMVANNPERAQVIYPLFTSENLINFDEVWSVIDGFGNDYFIDVYKKMLEQDQRPRLKKYFNYMLGRLYLSNGDQSTAREYFTAVLEEVDSKDTYNQLLYARTCEGMALASENATDVDYWTMKLYNAYPELVPFTDLKMKFRLQSAGESEANTASRLVGLGVILAVTGILFSLLLYILQKSGRMKKRKLLVPLPFVVLAVACVVLCIVANRVRHTSDESLTISGLKDCSIDFTNSSDAPLVTLDFTSSKDGLDINYEVRDDSGVLQKGIMHVPEVQKDDAGKLLAYRLFGIKKKRVGEEPEPEVVKKPQDAQKKKS